MHNLFRISNETWRQLNNIAQSNLEKDKTVHALKTRIKLQLKQIRLYQQLEMIVACIREKIPDVNYVANHKKLLT